jgi:hypothetical protein
MPNLPESTLGELLKLAEKATPAPWKHSTREVGTPAEFEYVGASGSLGEDSVFIADCGSGDDGHDAAFIAAANPSTVSALILELQALTEDNTRLNGLIEVFHGMCEPHRKLSLEPMDKRGGLECCMCIVERAEAAEAERDRMRDALERLDRDQVRIELECWCDYISDRPCGYCLMQAALTAKGICRELLPKENL